MSGVKVSYNLVFYIYTKFAFEKRNCSIENFGRKFICSPQVYMNASFQAKDCDWKTIKHKTMRIFFNVEGYIQLLFYALGKMH